MKMNIILFLSMLPNLIFGQIVSSIDKDSILIGDQITFVIQAENLDSNSLWPVFSDSLGQLEIVETSNIDSLKSDKGWNLTQSITITAWDSGYYKIDPIKIGENTSQQHFVYVNTISLTQEDTEIKDIKEPMEAPISFSEVLPYLLAILLLTVIIYFVRRFLKNREQKTPEIKEVKVIIPPYQIAISELEKLKAQKMWQSGSVKEYHTILSEIIRTYIETGLHTPAMEMPKADIIYRLTQRGIKSNSLDALLSTTDLVKFAKLIPTEIENENCMKIAFSFIQDTKPKEEVNNG